MPPDGYPQRPARPRPPRSPRPGPPAADARQRPAPARQRTTTSRQRAAPTRQQPARTRQRPAATRQRAARSQRPTPRSAARPTRRRQPKVSYGGFFWSARRWIFGIALIAFTGLAGGLYYLSQVPLPNAKPLKQTTFFLDSAGHVIASYSEQNRVDVQLKQVPQVAIDAVISTEDRHFFTEGALNPVSMIRAVIADLRGHGTLQGGSTITQQYVKQTYLSSERTFSRKLREAALAIRLARSSSKRQILQNYLNTIYWGRGAYGIEAASRAYFGKDVAKLGLREASLLAAMIREPVTADPARNAGTARTNQKATLAAMLRDGKITESAATAVERIPFSAYVLPPHASNGIVTSVPGDEYYVSLVHQQLVDRFGQPTVDGGGLRVTTTLDPTLQGEAYNSIYGANSPGSLNPAGGDPAGALVSIDDTGAVKAMVGGQDYSKSTVNLALGKGGGGSGRQAGSTFKAFMLAELIREGYSVQSMFPAPPEVVIPGGNAGGTPWDVKNYESALETLPPKLSIVDATANSVNTIFAQIVDKIGPDKLVSMAESLGISPTELTAPNLSYVLGTADVSPLEMAAAYSTFAADGVYHAPMYITKVTTADGKALPLPVKPANHPVLTRDQAALESYVLQQVVLRGTGGNAGGVGTPIAGKTGTTENSTDAWFIGYTPKLTTALWMGYPRGSVSMVGFRGHIKDLPGGSIPAALWHDYMALALASEPQYTGGFPNVNSFGSATLVPPDPKTLQFPQGLTGTTTTTSTSTTTTVPRRTSTTVPSPTTKPARPGHTTTTVARH